MNPNNIKISIFSLLLLISLISPNTAFADAAADSSQTKPVMSAEDYLKADLDRVFPVIQKMKKEEAAILITQIREEAKKNWKDSDKFYFLISHLESIKAIEEEHARLKSLNEVYLIGSLLLGGFLVFSIFRQRALIRKINARLDDGE
ncbi:hypothetical protein EHQ12_12875 [Leptospira gomenensis]|uniref:Uncharacterized protein n=1 Tax=Leptospira gomenensis TaxID=2484974 RepID=A0A5F1Y7F9_9LEPT|nr:hypothetical protein [Leptospira gomenensis]TGK28180.1 hypothetical protein EHQ17_19090 [Leptospira gomenensis]TGK36966.1 hypothetical protein EHQ12_12875 [Leptospira gomenensis]TGK45603.1 hypothetical protein EHQ07_07890 [Leptospira gomenensis]TGK59542.1 hypothetical protein EHQ13_12100 [Leptospira gomenensis]